MGFGLRNFEDRIKSGIFSNSKPANGKVLYPSCLPETDWIQREESPVIGRNMEVIRGLILARNFLKTIDNFLKYVIILA